MTGSTPKEITLNANKISVLAANQGLRKSPPPKALSTLESRKTPTLATLEWASFRMVLPI
jgi:hypothetical protein